MSILQTRDAPTRKQASMGMLIDNLRFARECWRDDPKRTAKKIGISGYGQVFFWTVGQDFIGIGMDKKWGPGLGHRIAPAIAARLPDSAKVAWTLKIIEIASDATKMPIEGRLYRRDGVVPDAVAAAVTQPLWSAIEVGEKLVGVVRHPERVNQPGQIEDSISSIYGTWTRNFVSLLQWRYAKRLAITR